MGKLYDPPISEETSPVTTVDAAQVKTTTSAPAAAETRDTAVTALGRSTVIPSTSLVDAYKKQLDDYDLFVLDKHPNASTKKERQQVLIAAMRLFQNILKLELTQARQCLDHFLKNVAKNTRAYNSGEILSPIFTMTKKEVPYDCKTERFMDLIIFLVDLQASYGKGGPGQFVARYRDLPYFFKDWPASQRNLLVDYVMTKVS